MKKIMKRLAVVLLVLTGAYTIAAYFMTRGLGIYRLGTTVGTILANSWQYTGFAALILLTVTLISLIGTRRTASRKIKTAAPQAADAGMMPEQPEIEQPKQKKRRGKGKTPEQGKIAPAQPESVGKIQPNRPAAQETLPMPEDMATQTMPMENAVQMPETGATMPMPMEDPVMAAPVEPAATMPMPVFEEPGATMPMPMAEESVTMPMPDDAMVLTGEPVCPRCGAAVKASAKFCGKCGMKLGG